MLTPAQVAHYETFGFLLLPQVFTAVEMADISRDADEVWKEDHERQPEKPYQIVVPFVEERPRLAQLPEDDRIYLSIADILGPGFVWGGSEGHKGSFTARVKVMIYLQPLRKETGALRVIPGSQYKPFREPLMALHKDLNSLAQNDTSLYSFGVPGPDLPCHPIEVGLGDVVMFNDYLFHGIYGKQEGRSFITLKYVKFAAEPTTEVDFEMLRSDDAGFGRLHEAFRGSQRPRIREMVEKLRGWEERLQIPK